jgi:hypothetical protein
MRVKSNSPSPAQRSVPAGAQKPNSYQFATGVVTRRLDRPRACFFSQAWVSADGRRLMVMQRSYARAPRTFSERQAQHQHEADAPAALLTVPLERHSATSPP